MTYSSLLEDLVTSTGGCGKFQWVTAIIGQSAKAIAAFSMLAMTFNGQQPNFYCHVRPETTSNTSVTPTFDKVCEPENVSTCDNYVFDDYMNTVVNEVGVVMINLFRFNLDVIVCMCIILFALVYKRNCIFSSI